LVKGCEGKLARWRALVGWQGESADVVSRLWMATSLLAWPRRALESFPLGNHDAGTRARPGSACTRAGGPTIPSRAHWCGATQPDAKWEKVEKNEGVRLTRGSPTSEKEGERKGRGAYWVAPLLGLTGRFTGPHGWNRKGRLLTAESALVRS
jgi:hypothetical protein